MNSDLQYSSKYGPWALVTGSAMGLGAEFACQLAVRGLNLVLADVNGEALKETADSLVSRTGVQVRSQVCDLSTSEGMSSLTESTSDLEIGMLVNNAGISAIGHFLDVPLERHLQILELNARTQLILAHHFGKGMRQRHRGGMIFVSSGSAVVGTSYVSAYSTTKAFNLNLGEALLQELRSSGVDVVSIIVGATDTPGFRLGNPNPDAKTWPPVMSVEETVRGTLNALGKTSAVIPGTLNALAMGLTMRLMPRPAAEKIMGAEMQKRYEGK